MPVCSTFVYGNLPIEIELGSDGEYWSAFVEHKKGVVFLDLSDFEIARLMTDSKTEIEECMEEYRRNLAEWKKR